MRSREEIRAAMTGPLASVHLPFQRNGEIDYDGLRHLLDHNIDAGSQTMLLTYGDSLFSLLTDQEVAEVTKVVAEHTAGRALLVAADRQWWTGQTTAFAQYARRVGADVLMVLPPDWAASCTLQTLVEHYAAVAQEMPVMVVTNVFKRSTTLGLEVLRVLRDQVPGVVAIKDDLCGAFARKMALLVHDDWAVVSGGQKQNHLDLLPYGCDGYLSTFIHFQPSITRRYLAAIESQAWGQAKTLIRDYDLPYFDFVLSLPGGFDAGFHGTLELFGLAPRWRRKPYYSLSDAEMEQLAAFFKSLALL